jgi:hypothetical protein
VRVWRSRGCGCADGCCGCRVLRRQLLLLLHEVVWHDLKDET